MLIWLFFKYKTALLVKQQRLFVNNTNSSVKNTQIVVLLKSLSKFWRSLEMPPINSKIYQELNLLDACILSSARDFANFKITDAKLNFPVVTLCTKSNVNLTKTN